MVMFNAFLQLWPQQGEMGKSLHKGSLKCSLHDGYYASLIVKRLIPLIPLVFVSKEIKKQNTFLNTNINTIFFNFSQQLQKRE